MGIYYHKIFSRYDNTLRYFLSNNLNWSNVDGILLQFHRLIPLILSSVIIFILRIIWLCKNNYNKFNINFGNYSINKFMNCFFFPHSIMGAGGALTNIVIRRVSLTSTTLTFLLLRLCKACIEWREKNFFPEEAMLLEADWRAFIINVSRKWNKMMWISDIQRILPTLKYDDIQYP